MLDVKWIRDNQDAFVKGLSDRGFGDPKATLTQILTMDEQRRETIQALQELQATRNAASKDIGKAKQAKDEAEAKRLMDEVAGLKAAIQEGEDKERAQDKALHDLLAGIPNMPADDVPVGPDESANVELRKVGAPPKFSFTPKEHFEIGEALGPDGFRDGGEAVGLTLRRAEGQAGAARTRARPVHARPAHGQEHGYTEVNPPLLVRDDTMFGTAQLPKFEGRSVRGVGQRTKV